MKACPECAEQIQSAAKVCRFCGHQFTASEIGTAQADEQFDRVLANIGKALPLFLIGLFIAWCSMQPSSQGSTTPVAAAVTDPKPCDDLIEQAEKAGLVRERPSPERVNVDDRRWADFPASSKRGLAMAVRCSATRGAPQQLDYGVVYGYRSGKRLAMATSVGVEFE